MPAILINPRNIKDCLKSYDYLQYASCGWFLVACFRCRVILHTYFTILFSVRGWSLITYCCWQLTLQEKTWQMRKKYSQIKHAKLMIKSAPWVQQSTCNVRVLHSVRCTVAEGNCHFCSASFRGVSNIMEESLTLKLPSVWPPLVKHEAYAVCLMEAAPSFQGTEGFGDEELGCSAEGHSLRSETLGNPGAAGTPAGKQSRRQNLGTFKHITPVAAAARPSPLRPQVGQAAISHPARAAAILPCLSWKRPSCVPYRRRQPWWREGRGRNHLGAAHSADLGWRPSW